MIKELRTPNLRSHLICSLESLSELTQQNYNLIKDTDNNPEDWWYWKIFNSVDTIFNDHNLRDDSKSEIGINLYDEEEAQMIEKYLLFFDDLLEEKIGYDLTGFDKPANVFLDHSDWPKVIKGAKEICEMMRRKNKRYEFKEFLKIYEEESWEQYKDNIIQQESNKTINKLNNPDSRIYLEYACLRMTLLTSQYYDLSEDEAPLKAAWYRRLADCIDMIFGDQNMQVAIANIGDRASRIGYDLYDQEEATKITEYMIFFSHLLKDKINYDINHPVHPDVFLGQPEWSILLDKGQVIYDMMLAKDKEYDLPGFLEIYETQRWEARKKQQ